MARSSSVLTGALTAIVCLPAFLLAQRPRPTTLDATIGQGGGLGGGELRDRQAVALDGVLAFALHAAPGGALVAGVSAAWQGARGHDASCLIGSRGQCIQSFPVIASVSVFAGWEGRRGTGRSPGATARFLAGPAFVYLDGDDSGGSGGQTAGLQARVDLATPHWGPFALVGSLRGTTVPRFRGESYRLWSTGLGLRVR